jgi:hypothetical protein
MNIEKILEKVKSNITLRKKMIKAYQKFNNDKSIEFEFNSEISILEWILPDLESALKEQNKLIDFIKSFQKPICEYCLNVFEKDDCQGCIIYEKTIKDGK